MADLKRFFREQCLRIPNAGHLPSYKVLQISIQAGIEQGLWTPGELLPPERTFADKCGLSVGTVKRAMLELVHQGVLFRRRGSGTFVAGAPFQRRNQHHYQLLEDFDAAETEGSVSLLQMRRIAPFAPADKYLELAPDDELYEILRIISAKERKCVLVCSYLPAKIFAGLDDLRRSRLEHVPLCIVFEEEFQIVTRKTDELLAAVAAGADEAGLLDIAPGTPVLQILSIMYSQESKPFEYRISHCLTRDKRLFRSISQ